VSAEIYVQAEDDLFFFLWSTNIK